MFDLLTGPVSIYELQCVYKFKEFFERKRMANKVQRIKPSLSKMKAAVSQDLLFLRTNKTDHKPKRGK